MCAFPSENINMQQSKISSKIPVGVSSIVYSVSCVQNIIVVAAAAVVVVLIVDSMQAIYCCYQQIHMLQYQMIGQLKRCDLKGFTRFTTTTTTQKHLHRCNRWHCDNNNCNYRHLLSALGQFSLNNMRVNMPVMMMGKFSSEFLINIFHLNAIEMNGPNRLIQSVGW